MPARWSAMAVPGPATPPPMIRTLVMALRWCDQASACEHATEATGRRHHPKVPIAGGTLGNQHARQGMHQRAIDAAGLARPTGAAAALGRGPPGWLGRRRGSLAGESTGYLLGHRFGDRLRSGRRAVGWASATG